MRITLIKYHHETTISMSFNFRCFREFLHQTLPTRRKVVDTNLALKSPLWMLTILNVSSRSIYITVVGIRAEGEGIK
jgi:hypothetical protein